MLRFNSTYIVSKNTTLIPLRYIRHLEVEVDCRDGRLSLFLLGTLGTEMKQGKEYFIQKSLFLLGTLGTHLRCAVRPILPIVSIPFRYIRHIGGTVNVTAYHISSLFLLGTLGTLAEIPI